jgi:predicted porin
MNKRRLALLLILLLTALAATPAVVRAADANIELNVNSDDVEGRFDVKLNPFEAPMSAGGGYLYSDDDEKYWIANANISVKDEVFVPALSLGLGLKGVYGNTDFGPYDRDTTALGFQFLGEYDFRKFRANLPFSVTAALTFAPDILSFNDTDKYVEFETAAYFHINYFAAVFVKYRDLQIDYTSSGLQNQNLSDDAFYLGIRLSF